MKSKAEKENSCNTRHTIFNKNFPSKRSKFGANSSSCSTWICFAL